MKLRALFLLTALIIAVASLHSAAQGGKLLLIIDPKVGIDLHLHNFRKAQDRFVLALEKDPSREGLSSVKASGSSQFSEGGLKRIKDRLAGEHILVVDLREESHGMINGVPMSWKGEHNWANKGKNLEEIQSDEQGRLEGLLAKRNVTVTRILEKDDQEELMEEDMHVKTARTEQEVCKAAAVGYMRIPVTDHCRPSDRIVDDFVRFYKGRPPGIWLHFHCKEGKGRTTTFMVLCDMIHNARKVSFEEIMVRQYLLGGANLLKPEPQESWKYQPALERVQFLRKFHEYCRANDDGYKTGWLAWLYKKEKEKEKAKEPKPQPKEPGK
jgi:hypothetical protein